MENSMKLVVMIIGALVFGAVIGWLGDQVGLSTPVTVAVALALVSAFEGIRNKKRPGGR